MSSRTAEPRTPRSARVSAGSCWATTLAKNAATPTWSRWSTAREARSKRATIASRSRWARRAPAPAWSTWRRSRSGHDVDDQRCQSRSSTPARSASIRGAVAQQGGEGGGPLDVGTLDPVEEPVLHDGQPQQLARRAPGVGVGQLLLAGAEAADERAQVGRVEAAERRQQQRLDPAGVEVVGRVGVVVVEVDHRAQRVEERHDRGVADERQVVGGDLDGYAGRGQRAAQRRDAGAARADQDGHPLPRDAVLEVGAAQQVGQPLGLGALGVVGDHLDAAVAVRPGHGLRRQERLARLGADAAGQREPAGDPAGGEEQPRPEASGAAQHHDRRRGRPAAVGKLAGKSRMPRTSAPRKP